MTYYKVVISRNGSFWSPCILRKYMQCLALEYGPEIATRPDFNTEHLYVFNNLEDAIYYAREIKDEAYIYNGEAYTARDVMNIMDFDDIKVYECSIIPADVCSDDAHPSDGVFINAYKRVDEDNPFKLYETAMEIFKTVTSYDRYDIGVTLAKEVTLTEEVLVD